MRAATTLTTLTAAGLLLAAAGCAEDPEEPDSQEQAGEDLDEAPTDEVEVSEDPDDVLSEEDQQAMEDIEPDSGQEDIVEEASGIGIGVEPSCVEPGQSTTVSAEGLDGDTEHVLRFDPEPASPDVLEPSVLTRSDDGGEIAVDLDLPDEGVDTGSYTVELLAAEDGQAEGEPLIDVDLEIAETCAT